MSELVMTVDNEEGANVPSSSPKKMKNSTNTRKQKRLIFYIILMALPMLQFFVLWFCVNINSILLAFKSYDFDTGDYTIVWFDNFKRAFHDFKAIPYFGASIRNTLIIYLCNLIIGTPLTLLFSFYIYKKMPANGLFKVILFLPSILSSLITVIIYKYFVDSAIPALWEMITGETIQGLLANQDTTLVTIIFFNVWLGFGTSTIMYSSTMSGISDSVVEAAELDGITPLKEFWYITVPMIWPTFVTFVIVGFSAMFTSQASLYDFYGNDAEYSLYTFGYYLYVAVRTYSMNEYPYLSSIGLILTAVALPLTLGLRKLMNKIGPSKD